MGLVPLDVVLVAEGTTHHDAAALLHVDALVGDDRHLVAEQRNTSSFADEVLVLLVVGVDEDGDTGRDEFGSRRRDDELVAGCVVADQFERDVVEMRAPLVVLHLDLRDSRLAVGTPDRRGLLPIFAALLVEVEEGKLRNPLNPRFDRFVGVVPVDRGPEVLHLLGKLGLVFRTDLAAAFLELAAFVVLVADVEFGLGQALAGNPVVVVAERKEHVAVVHPLESRGEVLQGRAVEVAHVQAARHRRRRRVDRVDGVWVPFLVAVVGVDIRVDPAPLPARLDRFGIVAALEEGWSPACSRESMLMLSPPVAGVVGTSSGCAVDCRP